jgi:archaellum component FlaG (FlaF/FlaG flagellin family)
MILKNNQAISPIFATLIILAVVTVLFIPVFIWATGTTSQTEDSWQTSGLIATERIVIEEVSLKGGLTSCTLYVRNIGKTAVSVDDVFISLDSGDLHVYEKSDFVSSPDSVVQGDLITVTIADLGFTPISDEVHTIKVFTTLGVGDTYQAIA